MRQPKILLNYMVDLDFTMLNPPGTAHFLSISDILRIAAEIEFHPSKKLGQNFLHDANTVRKIVRGAEVHPGDCVFEVGAGMGSLTLGLLNAGARVIAAEVDYRLAKRLHKTVGEMPARIAILSIPSGTSPSPIKEGS